MACAVVTGAGRRDPGAWLAAAVERAGYGPEDGLVVGVQQAGAPAIHLARGRTATGGVVGFDTVLYTASLSKQVTAACAALLVRRGLLDTDAPLSRWMPELPAWAATTRVRHLVHHTSGLPDVPTFAELEERGWDRTAEVVLGAVAGSRDLESAPGSAFRYCNAGYACLAVVVERVADQDLPAYADQHVFGPLGMRASRYWSGPAAHPPGAAPTEPGRPAALSLGDGGMWSTAPDLLRWNEALERDELGVSAVLHSAGRLDDGTPLDYGWGIGIRTHAGQRVHRHGGLWAGVSGHLLRVPGRRSSAVVIALDHDEDRTAALADGVVDHLTA